MNSGNFRDNLYNRYGAVNYALRYGLSPNPNFKYLYSNQYEGGDCSNFVSQCLYAGGAPFAFDNAPWWYNNMKTASVEDDKWSLSWAIAHSLYWCLKIRGNKNLRGLKGFEVNDIDLLNLGDLIQYEKDNGKIYHSGIITAFTFERGLREPLITQHTINAVNISYIKPQAVKYHYMKIVI